MKKSESSLLKVLCIIAAVFSTFSLHCRWGLYDGSETGTVLSILQKFGGTFTGIDFLDIIAFIAISVFFIKVTERCRFDLSALILSVILSVLYIVCRQYRDFDTLRFLFDSKYSLMVSTGGFVGYTALIYAVFVFVKEMLVSGDTATDSGNPFFRRFFWPISWIFIIACYMPWLILNYPGSGMPDTTVQFKNYLGDTPWSMWQPPLSSLLMGWCYSLGKTIKDADFGFFLYALLQTVAASGIFSYAVNRFKRLGASMKFCVIAVLFYGLVPMWGAYAQWVEKDFLFAAVGVLFTTYVLELYVQKELDTKSVIKLVISGLLCAFLRNNGIYAVIPTLFILCFFVSRAARKGLIIIAVSLLVAYEGVTRLLFPAIGVGGTSVSETIGFMFQQTARYVNTYPEEITEDEREVLVTNFQSMDTFGRYNPKFMDPVKVYYNSTAQKEYFSLWFKQFFKHPTVYVESYLNGSYGYLAPVEGDTGAYIMDKRDEFYTDRLGLSAGGQGYGSDILIAVLNPSKYQVLIKYFTYPGAYTWCMVLLLYILAHKKKKGAWTVFLPAVVTLLVCTVSPLACAMRYALLIAATVPVLAGWTLVCDADKEKSQTA